MPSPSMIAMMEEEESMRTIEGGGDTAQPFYYLAGPMSNIPAFNFPEFHRIAAILRDSGINLVNPAELDEEIERERAEASPDGTHDASLKTWADCLRRDVEIVTNPNCRGVIVIDGWERSSGAQFETYVANKLSLPILKYTDYPTAPENFSLRAINRRFALEAAGIVDA